MSEYFKKRDEAWRRHEKMAEFSEVIKQFKRGCPNGQCSTSTDCAMYPACNIGQCRKIAFERPAEFERRVMEWAEAHPEPEYPTWRQWLLDMDIIREVEIGVGKYQMAFSPRTHEHMPAFIAEKLGILPLNAKPKEGKHESD